MKPLFAFLLACTLATTTLFSQADNEKIEAAVATLAEGWCHADGERFASSFADVHDYIVWNGMFMKDMNRAGNAAAHSQLFQQVYANTNLWLKVDKIKYLRDDLARVHVYGAVYPQEMEPPADPGVIISLIMEKQEGNWKIIDFHNTDLEMHPASPQYAQYVTEQSEVLREKATGILQSWNERDAAGFAAFFQNEMDFAVGSTGKPSLNMTREELRMAHEQLFTQMPQKDNQVIQEVEVDFLNEETAICNATFRKKDGGPEAELNYMSLVFSKAPRTGEWLVRSFNLMSMGAPVQN